MSLAKVAASAFLNELQSIADGLGPDLREKLASSFYDHLVGDITVDQLAGFMKEAMGGAPAPAAKPAAAGAPCAPAVPPKGMGGRLIGPGTRQPGL